MTVGYAKPSDNIVVPFFHGVLSQWYTSSFVIDGDVYNCAEQWMMAEKARLFGDTDTLFRIMNATSPKDQKALGRAVNGFRDDVWLPRARTIVYRGNHAKFTQCAGLLTSLLDPISQGYTGAIGKFYFVEANPHDAVWGAGMGADDKDILKPDKWRGKNWLGQVLTDLRDDLLRSMNRIFVPDYSNVDE
jgi:ribA/ribD-fused uncharacterized protein